MSYPTFLTVTTDGDMLYVDQQTGVISSGDGRVFNRRSITVAIGNKVEVRPLPAASLIKGRSIPAVSEVDRQRLIAFKRRK